MALIEVRTRSIGRVAANTPSQSITYVIIILRPKGGRFSLTEGAEVAELAGTDSSASHCTSLLYSEVKDRPLCLEF